MDIKNTVIIGSGPAGLSAGIYSARANLSPIIIAGIPSGGQLMQTTEVENYPGFESILGPELIMKMTNHAKKFGTEFINQNVVKIETDKYPYKLILSDNSEILAKTILIATGASAQWLNIESEQRLKGKGVSACATCDGFFFKEKTVAIVGGGDTAMEEALYLTRFAKKVYVIHRRNEFRASKIMQDRVKENEKIELVLNAQIDEIIGQEKVEAIKLNKSEFAEENAQVPEEIQIDGLFIAIGHKPNTDFLKDSGIEIDKNGYVKVTQTKLYEVSENREFLPEDYDFHWKFQTNKKGIFACGDVIDKVYRQATTAVGTGVSASLEIEKFLQDK